jgi:phosphoribosylformylglycinamidine cyclo-ligase
MAVFRMLMRLYYIALAKFATYSFSLSPDGASDRRDLPASLTEDIQKNMTKPLTYREAGVDIDAGNDLVEKIKPMVAATRRSEVLAGLGGFGGLFALQPGKYREPVLVSGTDGVGTKLKLAQSLGIHDTIGVDLVAMCVNDVLVQGAEPLFFLDYFACGKLDVDVAAKVVSGIADGCVQAGAALIGGETAEMPDMYPAGEYDLAGFCVGVVERDALIDGSSIAVGDAIIGISSSGPHSNGYSLIRRILERDPHASISGRPAAIELLRPTRIYVKAIMALMDKLTVKGLAHITGGGLTENIPRIMHGDHHAQVQIDSWKRGAVFDWLAKTGGIEQSEMRRTFNCGVGMIAIVDPADQEHALQILESFGETAWRLGQIAAGAGGVEFI